MISSYQTSLQGKEVLLIEDDRDMLQLLTLVFNRRMAQVYTALDGLAGLRQFFTHRPDLVVTDVVMPEINGWEVCRQIRRFSDVPVIVLTNLGKDEDVVKGLDIGADDYIAKPFAPNVLVARSAALLRRQYPDRSTSFTIYEDSHLTINLDKRQVLVEKNPVRLTSKEFKVLAQLFRQAGQTLTYEQILEAVWGWEYKESVDYVHVHLSNLRRKLEPNRKQPKYLITEHGVGYRFEINHDDKS